jgi:hypothetical protein
MISEAERKFEQGLRIRIFNFDIEVAGRLDFDLHMGELLKGGILILILGGLYERHTVKRGIWVPTQHLL